MRRTSEVMKTKSVVRPREIHRMLLALERLFELELLGGNCVEAAILLLSEC